MKLIIQRDYKANPKVIFNKLFLPNNGHFPNIYGIERPWLNNQRNISCIPAGIYNCIPHISPSKGKTWLVDNVPNRDNILFAHSGNFACKVTLQNKVYEPDTDGCLIFGYGIEENIPMITESKLAISWLQKRIGLNNSFTLEIRD